MHVLPKRQQGLTLISLIFIFVFVGTFVLVGIKVVPIYIDHYKVVSALEDLQRATGTGQKTKEQIWESLYKRFFMNYVTDVKAEDVTITKEGGNVKITVEYEVVKNIAGNLSVLVEFKDEVEVGGQ
ncbi:MAG: DUF4845 domain-containing protein [Methylococcales bacterium]|nr:DUF4845 domain-containing protein [Methylococcales bacterium]